MVNHFFRTLVVYLCIFNAYSFDLLSDLSINEYSSVESTANTICPSDSLETIAKDDYIFLCNFVKNSPVCEKVKSEDRIECKDSTENQIDFSSWYFIKNCTGSLLKSVYDFMIFVKDALVWIGKGLMPEEAMRRGHAVSSSHESIVNFLSIELEKAMEVEQGQSNQTLRAFNAVAGNLVRSAVKQISKELQESFTELGCYKPAERSFKICSHVSDFFAPPLVALKALKFGNKFIEKRVSSRDYDGGAVKKSFDGHILQTSGKGAPHGKAHPGKELVETAVPDDILGQLKSLDPADQQKLLNEIFNQKRADNISSVAAKAANGEDLVFYRSISADELSNLLTHRESVSSILRKNSSGIIGQNQETVELMAKRLKISEQQAREIVMLPAGKERLEKLRKYVDPDVIKDSHNQDVTFLDPYQSVSLGPHYLSNNNYLVVIKDGHKRAHRNETGDYEGEWLLYENYKLDEVVEILTPQEAARRFSSSLPAIRKAREGE